MAIYARADGMEDCAKIDDGDVRSTAAREWVVEGCVVVAYPTCCEQAAVDVLPGFKTV
jgi:hypothetical protein